MKRAKIVREVEETTDKSAPKLRALPASTPRLPTLGTALVHEVVGSGVILDLGGKLVAAMLDASVHPTVIAGACKRRERVLIERGEDGAIVVLGALRTQPTPGIDAAETFTIEAKRISLDAGEELSLKAQTAAVVLRAVGEVETYAERILSRAEGVHKIIGRMLRLN